jgi:transposase-like protein
VSELASLHSVHPTLIHAWKKQLVNHAEELFQSGAKASGADHEVLVVIGM